MSDFVLPVLLVAAVVAIILIFAQIRLFSIDRTLKAILSELRGNKPEAVKPRGEVLERLRQRGLISDK